MDPIERVSDAVAALVGRDMTLEDAHQFILEAAQMMEPVKMTLTHQRTEY